MGQKKPKRIRDDEETTRSYDEDSMLRVQSHRPFISACADDGVSFGERAWRFLSDDSDRIEKAFRFAHDDELNFD